MFAAYLTWRVKDARLLDVSATVFHVVIDDERR